MRRPRPKPPATPAEALASVRQRIREYLRHGPKGLRDISQELGISERDALDHLEHLSRARAGGERLRVIPAECLACGYVFRERQRLGKPGRCPVCKAGHIAPPMYEISAPGEG